MSATRTPSLSLSLHALLTFPIRLCNPPPAASSVRSCKGYSPSLAPISPSNLTPVTPLIKVSLDDVLNKRHLPPLTLKDFEEWLVFVEGNPQYLYFILWLKEYEARYAAWLAEYGYSYAHPFPASLSSTSLVSPSPPSNTPSQPSNGKPPSPSLSKPTSSISLASNTKNPLKIASTGQSPLPPLSPSSPHLNYIPPSPSLALFFTRAKKTFFTFDSASGRGPYTLVIPDGVYANGAHGIGIAIEIKTASQGPTFGPHPHPHPKELAHIAAYARSVLKESLERFAVSACHNVGSRRAW
ncbi:hypothetical protein BU17DRAFT_96577 [Hysterangium stoloniferum]|nr:hypothetical protein BU17DRAFT_96577 [Hysterangium stoloniferum]